MNSLTYLTRKEGAEDADGVVVAELLGRTGNGALNLGLEGGVNAVEHEVEGGKLADLVLGDGDGDLLKDAKHGALADGAVLALEGASF